MTEKTGYPTVDPLTHPDESVNWLDRVVCGGCGRTTTWHDLRDHASCAVENPAPSEAP